MKIANLIYNSLTKTYILVINKDIYGKPRHELSDIERLPSFLDLKRKTELHLSSDFSEEDKKSLEKLLSETKIIIKE